MDSNSGKEQPVQVQDSTDKRAVLPSGRGINGRRLFSQERISRATVYGPKEWDTLKKSEQLQALKDWTKEREAAKELEAMGDKTGFRDLGPMPVKRRSSYTAPQEDLSQALRSMRAMPVKPQSWVRMGLEQKEHLTSRLRTYRRIMNVRKAVRRALRTEG